LKPRLHQQVTGLIQPRFDWLGRTHAIVEHNAASSMQSDSMCTPNFTNYIVRAPTPQGEGGRKRAYLLWENFVQQLFIDVSELLSNSVLRHKNGANGDTTAN
jgi:hypothetical protein